MTLQEQPMQNNPLTQEQKHMNNTEIIEGNKLIDKFMGAIRRTDYGKNNDYFSYISAIKYHSSWDWLMPVVEKIQSLGFKFIIGDSNRVTVYNKDYDWRNGHTEDFLIECVWHGVVQFIKWYNNQNKQS